MVAVALVSARLERPMTVGELARCANDIPEDEVIGLISELIRKSEGLAQGDDRQLYLRHLIVLGGLVNRAIFDVCDVPKDVGATI
jgi:hypothetical protein